MSNLIFSHGNLRLLHLLCIFAHVYSSNEFQNERPAALVQDSILKHLQDKANEQLETDKICNQANITNVAFVPEDNVIKVNFRLSDEKFQRCFEYFKIILEKKRKIIKEEKIPYLRDIQKKVSYSFENVSCGVYEIFVQPCRDDRFCPFFRWSFEQSINVTSKDCIDILQTESTSVEKTKIFIFMLVPVLIVLLCMCCSFLILRRRLEKLHGKASTADPDYIKFAPLEHNNEAIRSIHIFIFHKYHKNNVIKKEVETLKAYLAVLFKYLLDVCKRKGLHHAFHCSIRTIDSELPIILDNVDDWLNEALKEDGSNLSLQKIILVQSAVKEEEDDALENLILSELKWKLKNNVHKLYNEEENVYPVRFQDIPTYSEELADVVDLPVHYFPKHGIDLFVNLCAGFIFNETSEHLRMRAYQYLKEHPDAIHTV